MSTTQIETPVATFAAPILNTMSHLATAEELETMKTMAAKNRKLLRKARRDELKAQTFSMIPTSILPNRNPEEETA